MLRVVLTNEPGWAVLIRHADALVKHNAQLGHIYEHFPSGFAQMKLKSALNMDQSVWARRNHHELETVTAHCHVLDYPF